MCQKSLSRCLAGDLVPYIPIVAIELLQAARCDAEHCAAYAPEETKVGQPIYLVRTTACFGADFRNWVRQPVRYSSQNLFDVFHVEHPIPGLEMIMLGESCLKKCLRIARPGKIFS